MSPRLLSPLKGFYRQQLSVGVTTTSPWTTDFRHLARIPRKHLQRLQDGSISFRAADTRDRIKYWNVVPGDQIRIKGLDNRIRDVALINRVTNRVYVRGPSDAFDSKTQGVRHKNYHYSRCQLYLGEFEYPSVGPSEPPKTVRVFAKRVGTTKPKWNAHLRRYEWERFASATEPRLPPGQESKPVIPWPRPPKRELHEPGVLDTPQHIVAEVTYKPPAFSPVAKHEVPKPPSEASFLRALYNPRYFLSPNAPVEIYLYRELSNPHSRANKLERRKTFMRQKSALLKDFLAQELGDLRGRSAREAKVDAFWKWQRAMRERRLAARKARLVPLAEKTVVRREKKAKKAEQLRKRLTNLTLKEEENQLLPESA
ncbi:hypothetical protein FISHEDRAFT_48505 [Fistulina hepatica ATCC 64428]|uniref:Uncharacterized protein n=1 Tax=Fistulina hepatica ATCC 64428 TaxID=1128425 RepID=A0A0D7A557_9AGAR|nr:hypothetical protein FISHEDRAFT_48505 [Fistulina hepatica ATCC 64428]